MYSLLFLGGVSFVLSLLLTPLIRNLCRHWGIADHPDGARKLHQQPIPHLGGIPLFMSVIGAFGLLIVSGAKGGDIVQKAIPIAVRLAPAVVFIFLTGLLDDLIGLRPWQKIIGQLLAGQAAYWGGIRIASFAGNNISGWWSLPITLAWLVICTNAFNLIDGIDGLASGVGLFAATSTLLAAIVQNNFALAAATIPLVGGLLGFLRYNFNPATMFLGDSGSLLIGFLLGSYGVVWSQKSTTLLGMIAPLMALSIPLLDTCLAIVRRVLRGQPIFAGDRNHIHHRLLARGLTPRRAVLLLYGVCGLAALFSLSMTHRRLGSGISESFVLVLFCLVVSGGIQQLGYAEFGVFARMFMNGAFLKLVSSRIALQSFEARLTEAATPADCWEVIAKAAAEFGFQRARLALGNQYFEYWRGGDEGESWTVRLPLPPSGYMEFSLPFEDLEHAAIVAPFLEMIRRVLEPSSSSFSRLILPAQKSAKAAAQKL